MHNLGFALDGAWQVLLAGLALGAGLPILFALGIRSLAWGAGATTPAGTTPAGATAAITPRAAASGATNGSAVAGTNGSAVAGTNGSAVAGTNGSAVIGAPSGGATATLTAPSMPATVTIPGMAAGIEDITVAGPAGPDPVVAVPGPRRPLGTVLGYALFAVVIIGVVLGLTFIVAGGFGYKLDFSTVYPTLVAK